MNMFQWNFFFDKFAWRVFSGMFYPGITIVTHMLSETLCMLWYKALQQDQLQVHIGIRGCRHFKMRGPGFAGKQRCVFFNSLDVSLFKSLVKLSANLFVVYLNSNHIAETPSDSNIQDLFH